VFGCWGLYRSSIFIISPTEVGTSPKIYTNPANILTPSLVNSTISFSWKTDLTDNITSAGIIMMIPSDQLLTVTTGGIGNVVSIADGFTSLSSIRDQDGTDNVIEAVTSSTTELRVYNTWSTNTRATIEASANVALAFGGIVGIMKVKGNVTSGQLAGTAGVLQVEGNLTNVFVMANLGISFDIRVNGNGCDGFSDFSGTSKCSTTTATVMVTTQSCTSSAGPSECTSAVASGSTECSCSSAPTSAAARMDHVLAAMVSGVTGLMAFFADLSQAFEHTKNESVLIVGERKVFVCFKKKNFQISLL
jgi:hypothetical protein